MENEASTQITEQTQPQEVAISLNDLGTLANIINLATTRGAFKANELSTIGAVYDKLNAFLVAATAQNAPQTEDSDKKETSGE